MRSRRLQADGESPRAAHRDARHVQTRQQAARGPRLREREGPAVAAQAHPEQGQPGQRGPWGPWVEEGGAPVDTEPGFARPPAGYPEAPHRVPGPGGPPALWGPCAVHLRGGRGSSEPRRAGTGPACPLEGGARGPKRGRDAQAPPQGTLARAATRGQGSAGGWWPRRPGLPGAVVSEGPPGRSAAARRPLAGPGSP